MGETMILLLRWLSPLTYLISSVVFYRYFSNRDLQDLKLARMLDRLAIFIHFLFLSWLTFLTGHLPLAGTFQAISTFMFFFAILNKVIVPEKKDYSLGFFYSGLLFLLQALSMFYISETTELPVVLKNVVFEVHVALNLIGYAAYSSSFLVSFVYLLLFHEIKSNKLGYFYDRLPSLAYLEMSSIRAVVIGFLFSSAGIVSGAFTGIYAWGKFWAWDPKLVSALFAWVVYGFMIVSHYRLKWSGKTISIISVLAFLWIIFSMLIITRYFSGIHAFIR
jgi:ABC-type uncharacterized transport system permease subunit